MNVQGKLAVFRSKTTILALRPSIAICRFCSVVAMSVPLMLQGTLISTLVTLSGVKLTDCGVTFLGMILLYSEEGTFYKS